MPRITTTSRPARIWPPYLLVLLASLATFLPALQNGFVNWDDYRFVVDNPNIRGLGGAQLLAMFTSFVDGNYIPLTQLSFAINYALHGLAPAGFHFTNMLLHGLNAALVLYFLRRLGGGRFTSVVGALLFALHPLRVESVAWATERKDVLFALFYLLALLAYLRYQDTRRYPHLALVFLLFVLSGLAKQMAISLPVILLVLDYTRARRFSAGIWLEKIPFVIATLGLVAVAYLGQHSTESILKGTQYTPLHRLLLSCNSLVMYLKGILWPSSLCCVYPYPKDVVAEAAYTPFVVITLAALLFWRGRTFKPWHAGPLFFVVSLAPVLNVVPAGSQMVADRFTYLPSVGLSFLAVALLDRGWPRWSRRGRQAATSVITLILVLLAILTWNRTRVWRNDLTLWTDTIQKAPDSFIAQSNLALAHMNQGDYEKAVPLFGHAIAISPTLSDSYHNRGQALRHLGKLDEALADFTMALTLEPEKAVYWFNRAEVYFDREDLPKALTDYDRALELDPTMAAAWLSRGIAHGMQGDFSAAISDFTRLLDLDPRQLDARFNRGKAYFESRQLDAALQDFNAIVEQDPTYAKAIYHRAVLLLQQQRAEEAWRDLRRVQELGFVVADDILQQVPASIRTPR